MKKIRESIKENKNYAIAGALIGSMALALYCDYKRAVDKETIRLMAQAVHDLGLTDQVIEKVKTY